MSRARRVPSVIYDNFCRCLDPGGPGSRSSLAGHTEHVTPLMAGRAPPIFLLSNSIGTVGGVPTCWICILSDCLGVPVYFDAWRYHVLGDLDRVGVDEVDRAVYELGVGWIQSVPQIPFEMLQLTSGGRRAYIIGDLVQNGVELVPVVQLRKGLIQRGGMSGVCPRQWFK
jgi:hypothetical protein